MSRFWVSFFFFFSACPVYHSHKPLLPVESKPVKSASGQRSPRLLKTTIADQWTVTTLPSPLNSYHKSIDLPGAAPPHCPLGLSTLSLHPPTPFNPGLQTALSVWTMEPLLPQGGVLWRLSTRGCRGDPDIVTQHALAKPQMQEHTRTWLAFPKTLLLRHGFGSQGDEQKKTHRSDRMSTATTELSKQTKKQHLELHIILQDLSFCSEDIGTQRISTSK